MEPSDKWPRDRFTNISPYKGKQKKTSEEEIILALERHVSKVSPCDFFLDTMENVSRLLGDKYLKEK